jgi:tRNA pseudouridine55 synthase
VRRLAGAGRAGHAGTLDPLASGVLPIALGEATKTVPDVMDAAKTYRFTVRWGERRATDDSEGDIVEACAERPAESAIRQALDLFRGRIVQTPPAFSAIKIGGARAYALARAGEAVVLTPREVDIHRLDLIETLDADHAVFEVESGKGVYVRALARDLAQSLGTVGHLSALRRLKVGRFRAENAISLDFTADRSDMTPLSEHVLPIETALDDIPALALTASEAQRLRCGQPVGLFTPHHREWLALFMAERREPGRVLALSGGSVVAMVRIERAEALPVRVFNLEAP